jgi:hypothetical protein
MRKGIRTTKHSLKQCVECHASSKTGSVAASKEDFCSACHVMPASNWIAGIAMPPSP